VKYEEGTKNSPQLSLLKIFAISLPYASQPFLAAALDFTSFFRTAFLGAAHFFTGLFLD